MEKQFAVELDVKFSIIMPALSEEDAIEKVKESMKEEHNFTPTDDEITKVEVIREDKTK